MFSLAVDNNRCLREDASVIQNYEASPIRNRECYVRDFHGSAVVVVFLLFLNPFTHKRLNLYRILLNCL